MRYLRSSDRRRDGSHLFSIGVDIGLGLIATLAVIWSTSRYGVGVSPDSAMYLSAAKSLVSGHGFIGYRGEPIASWPPLYPFLLASATLTGLSPLTAARLFGAITILLIVVSSGRLLQRILTSRTAARIATLAVALSWPLILVSTKAWTEPIFVLIVLVFFLLLSGREKKPVGVGLIGLSCVAALAMLQRYIGISLLLTGCIILITDSAQPLNERLKKVAAFGAVSLLPLILWLSRNYSVTGTLTGPRAEIGSGSSLIQAVTEAAVVVASWIVPPQVPTSLQFVLFSSVCITILILLRRSRFSNHSSSPTATLRTSLVVFTVIYFPLVISASVIGTIGDLPNNRYLIGIYIPVLALVALTIEKAVSVRRGKQRFELLLRSVLIGFCVLWFVYSSAATAAYVSIRHELGGGGYNTQSWHESETIAWLRDNPPESAVYSNVPAAVFHLIDFRARHLAELDRRNSGHDGDSADSSSVVVWFYRADRAVSEFLAASAQLQVGVRELITSGSLSTLRSTKTPSQSEFDSSQKTEPMRFPPKLNSMERVALFSDGAVFRPSR